MTRTPTSTNNVYLNIRPSLTAKDINKTLTITADIYTPHNTCMVQIYNNPNYWSVEVPQNTGFQKVSVSHIISRSDAHCFINILQAQDCYIDNIQVTLQ